MFGAHEKCAELECPADKYLYVICVILYYHDQHVHNYFTDYHTPATCFDTIVSSSGSLQSIPCQVTPVLQMK